MLIVWFVPFVLIISLLGFALALVLSFPVQWFSHFMSRGLAILVSCLIVLVIFVLALLFLVPLIMDQVTGLVQNLPALARNLESYLIAMLEPLQERGFLTRTPEEIVSGLGESLRGSFDMIVRNTLSGVLGFLYGTVNVAFTLFGMSFVGISLLTGMRSVKATYLTMVPKAYRRDAYQLWGDLAHSLSRYAGGLGLILLIQGAMSAVALHLIGVPYALALGAWVSVTAVIPYIGAWLGAIPALVIAFSVSWTAVLLTALTFLAIQQLEGNVLTPKIQGETLDVPAVVVFLAVIVGGGLGGLFGVIFAVPTVAVLKVFFDFFRVRLTTAE
ncbi:MAG: AI-2E family transporter [Pseudomonadota bacterium]|nr:AI-2E family transporter [Pseudomonadota bacterium]